MTGSQLRRLPFEQLVLPSEIKALGRPDAVFGLHPKREHMLWAGAIVPAIAGLLAALWIFATRAQTPVHPGLLLGALLIGGGTSLAVFAHALNLKGRILLVYLDCLVLMDYEHSRIVAVADERTLRSFFAPVKEGYAELARELTALSLVDTEASAPEAIRQAVGPGSGTGRERRLNTRGRAGIALAGIGLGVILLSVMQADNPDKSESSLAAAAQFTMPAPPPAPAQVVQPDSSQPSVEPPAPMPVSSAGSQFPVLPPNPSANQSPRYQPPAPPVENAGAEPAPVETVAPETVGQEKISPEGTGDTGTPSAGGDRSGP